MPINWVKIENRYGERNEVLRDSLCVYSQKSASQKYPKIRIAIGTDLVTKLGWAVNDKIGIFYNPDDYLHFQCAKCDTGYKLVKCNLQFALEIRFTYRELSLGKGRKEIKDFILDETNKTLEFIFR